MIFKTEKKKEEEEEKKKTNIKFEEGRPLVVWNTLQDFEERLT